MKNETIRFSVLYNIVIGVRDHNESNKHIILLLLTIIISLLAVIYRPDCSGVT